MKFGIYRLHEPAGESGLAALEKKYGTAIHVVSVFRAWNHCSMRVDRQWLDRLKHIPRDILLTWEPWMIPRDDAGPAEQPDFSLEHIISGRYDEYIRSFSRELSTFPRRIMLRTMHEMNGDWYPWCGTVNGNSPEKFIRAWYHIRNIVSREVPPGKIEWVWSPYAHSYPSVPENSMEHYFPGDDALDWAAIDGYNWGRSREWSRWQSFEDIFSDACERLTAVTRRPLMIGETACGESGGSKAEWICDAFKILGERFDNIKMLVWFDVKKECDWRISSSPQALSAFRKGSGIFNG